MDDGRTWPSGIWCWILTPEWRRSGANEPRLQGDARWKALPVKVDANSLNRTPSTQLHQFPYHHSLSRFTGVSDVYLRLHPSSLRRNTAQSATSQLTSASASQPNTFSWNFYILPYAFVITCANNSWRRLCFWFCLSVCLCVCVSSITAKVISRCHWNFAFWSYLPIGRIR